VTRARLSVVVDGQFGSCGKGALAGWLSLPVNNPDQSVTVVRVGGPNAGHTVYGPCPDFQTSGVGCCDDCDEHGHPWRLRQVPVGAVTHPDSTLVIAAGSEVDYEVLHGEIELLEAAGLKVRDRLRVDTNATVLTPEHRLREIKAELTDRIGSTGKGIGAARADRTMRTAQTVGQKHGYQAPEVWPFAIVDTAELLDQLLRDGAHVIIEGTQGYGLGLHTRFYPKTTSGDCRAIDFLAQAGINPWNYPPQELAFWIWMAIRPNPIRVAGNSGPLKGETTWHTLNLPTEQTTVTKKTRRVGAWDGDLVRQAVRANGASRVILALMMGDHIDPDIAGVTHIGRLTNPVIERTEQIEKEVGAPIGAVGTSPITICPLVPRTTYV
jgi:adenylosuccinate synthase